jgi:hypothetical protein
VRQTLSWLANCPQIDGPASLTQVRIRMRDRSVRDLVLALDQIMTMEIMSRPVCSDRSSKVTFWSVALLPMAGVSRSSLSLTDYCELSL